MSYEFRHPLGMMQLQWSVCLLLSLVVGVQCYSTGAPASACSDIYPVGHPATSQDLSTNPFQLSLSDFDQTDGGEIYYVLGQDYTLTLSGSGGEQFRGFLVQARAVADGSPVGTFIDNGDDQTLSSCDPPESAVTHTNSSLKNYLTLNWTAPLQGAGGIRFLYAVVLSRDEFYATQNTDVLHSCGLPLYESDGRCVETCPDGQFGNGSTTTLTGTCDPLPTDFTATLNATVYYAQIDEKYQLNASVFKIRAIFSTTEELEYVYMSITQANETDGLLEFDGGSDNRIALNAGNLVPGAGDGAHVFDTSINLVEDPAIVLAERGYPINIDINIKLVVLYHPGIPISAMAKGLGCIKNSTDPCDGGCEYGGTCIRNSFCKYSCSCRPGYTGTHCQEDDHTVQFCKEDGCFNGGTCVEEFGNDTRCHCVRGYRGDQCTEDDPTQLFCNSDTCTNGGVCIEISGPHTHCECARGITGRNCSEDDPAIRFCNESSNFCENGGTCNELYGTDTNCSCASGFTGDHCTEDDPSVSFCTDDTCTHGGTCQETFGDSVSCLCAVGFVGNRCEWMACNSFCQNGGTCYQVEDLSPIMCVCPPQFKGSQCETVVCEAETDVPVFPGSSMTYSWSWTEGGRTQTRPCPDICRELIDYPSGAVVERLCHRDSGQWLDTDFTACGLTITALQLCEASQVGLQPLNVAKTVLNITSNQSALDYSAITVTSDIIANLTDAAVEDTQVYDTYLSIIDNVLEGRKDQLLISQMKSNSSTRILREINRLHNEIPLGDQTQIMTITLRNYGVIVLDINASNENERKYDSFSADLGAVETAVLSKEQISPEQLIVSSGILSNVTGSLGLKGLDECAAHNREHLRIVYSVYRTDALFLTPETACDLYAISSIIVGVNASKYATKLSAKIDLERLMEVCLNTSITNSETAAYESYPAQHQIKQVCSKFKTDGAGRWSSEDCRETGRSGGRTQCDCSQLGHFGLFFDLNPGEPLSPLAIATISYIGAIVSVFCLLLLLLTYLSSKTLRRTEHGRILINISVSLLCLYMVFVVAGLVTSVEPLCGLVAALFHYIMLVFFGWTAAEAVFLYHKLAVVLGNPIHHYVWKAGLTVWLSPLVVTAISVGLGHKYYINPYYCRATEWPFWLGHILPVSIIGLFNWIVFAIILLKLCLGTVKVDVERDSARRTFKKNFFIAVGLSLLLGLGWGFGLTATSSDLKELTFALQVIFSLFVGSQGVLIFVFHGLRSRQFRLVWTSAFGLRSKHRPLKDLAKKESGSDNMHATGTYCNQPLKHPWAGGNRVISNTDIDFEQQWVTQMSSFEPHGDTPTETVKEVEERSA